VVTWHQLSLLCVWCLRLSTKERPGVQDDGTGSGWKDEVAKAGNRGDSETEGRAVAGGWTQARLQSSFQLRVQRVGDQDLW
jgi:hypothetical protein